MSKLRFNAEQRAFYGKHSPATNVTSSLMAHFDHAYAQSAHRETQPLHRNFSALKALTQRDRGVKKPTTQNLMRGDLFDENPPEQGCSVNSVH